MVWEEQKKLSGAAFKKLSGVKRETFERMLAILEKEYRASHKNGGRPPKLSACDKLRIALQYLRECRTMFHIACGWGVAKSTVCDSVKWAEAPWLKTKPSGCPARGFLRGQEAKFSTSL